MSAKKYSETLKHRDDFTKAQTAFYGLASGFVREVGVRKISAIGVCTSIILWFWLRDWRLVEITLIFTVIIVAFELMNSSIEELADIVQPEKSEAIKQVKDLAAGAVFLIMACAVVYIGVEVASKFL